MALDKYSQSCSKIQSHKGGQEVNQVTAELLKSFEIYIYIQTLAWKVITFSKIIWFNECSNE